MAKWTRSVQPRLMRYLETAGFECNGLHAGPLSYRPLGAPHDRIGSYRLLWTGKHCGKQMRPLSWAFAE